MIELYSRPDDVRLNQHRQHWYHT